MSGKRYTDEFKIEAVKQVTERGHSVADVAQRLGITTHSLYAWKLKSGRPDVVRQAELDQSAEVRRLKAELKRMTEERDILKKPRNLQHRYRAKHTLNSALSHRSLIVVSESRGEFRRLAKEIMHDEVNCGIFVRELLHEVAWSRARRPIPN